MKDSRSEHKSQNLNARLLRFRAEPDSENAYELGEALIAAQRYADARSVVSAAQPKSSDDGALLVLEGRAWLLERDLVRAQAVLLRAVKAAPQLQPAYRWLGEVLLKRGDPQRAAKTLHRALQLDPDDADAAKLAARAEYLSEAVNDGLEPATPDADSTFDSEPAERRQSREPPPPAAHGGGRAQASRADDSAPLEPPTIPLDQGRVLPKPYMAGPADVTRPARPSARGADGGPPLGRNPPPAAGRPASAGMRANESQAGRAPPPSATGRNAAGAMSPLPSAAQPPGLGRSGPPSSLTSLSPPPFAAARRNTLSAPASPASPPTAAGRSRSSSPDALAAPKRARASDVNLPPVRPTGAPEQPLARQSSPSGLPRVPSRASPPTAPRAGRPAQRTFPRPEAAERAQPAEELKNPEVRFAEDSSPALDVATGVGVIESEPPPSAADDTPVPEAPAESVPLRDSQLSLEQLAARDALLRAAAGASDAPMDADAVLSLVQRLGMFEQRDAQPAQWTKTGELEPQGQRLRNTLLVVWGVTLALCVGGYFGWNEFVARRHARAAELVATARALMLRGDHGALVDAERMLRLAREQHPASLDVPREALLVQEQRVLDDGERDMAALRSAFARAHAAKVEGPVVALGDALLSAATGETAARDKSLANALAAAQGDARIVYLVGRAEQRAGRPDAITHLQAAAHAEAKLAPAQLALAELAYDAGDREAAQRAVNAALLADSEQLRARLLRAFMSADDSDPAEVRRDLAQLEPAMKKAGNIDRALSALVRARLARRQGDSEGAAKAVNEAGSAGADEPRLLAWVAREALALGKLPLAQHLASQALSAAPDVAQNRRLLARILIDRNDGEHALQLLEKLPADDLDAQIMKAQAALLSSDPAALKAALDGLAQVPANKRELVTTVGALRVRIEARLTPGKAVVDRARALVRSAPGDAAALLAWAEAALAAHDPTSAQNALKQRFVVAPDDPNAHVLLGRARRMAVDAEGAEASFRRALELAPGSADALTALAELLLDEGKYGDADTVYQELATRGGSMLIGRLGRVDALTGLGRTADAEVQLAAIPEAQASSAAVRVSASRLALARGKAGDALTILRPLADEKSDNASIVALYGDALLAAQQLEAAGKAYDAALAVDSELPEAVLGHAEVLLRTGKAKDALPMLQKAKDVIAQRIRPPALQARRLTLLGRAFLARNKRGDEGSGKDALREATQIPGAPADSFYFLAESLGGKNNPEARAAYQRYLELDPHGQYRDRARRAAGSSP